MKITYYVINPPKLNNNYYFLTFLFTNKINNYHFTFYPSFKYEFYLSVTRKI